MHCVQHSAGRLLLSTTTSSINWGRRSAAGKGARHAARHHSWFEHRPSPPRRALAAGGRRAGPGRLPQGSSGERSACPSGPRLAAVLAVLTLAHPCPVVLRTRLARRRLDATAPAPGNITCELTSHRG